MATKRLRKRTRRFDAVSKPAGLFHPRVQKVGPEHFGIVSVDCAKARSKWMLADFYGNILVAPTTLPHNRNDFDAAFIKLRKAMQKHAIPDSLIAVERTGRYHQPVQRAFTAAGWEVRIVHPYATKQFRQPADPGNKTDDTDLMAIHRAAVSGFALIEQPLELSWQELQLLVRHRRDLVRKASKLCCQIREHLESAMPGYAANFENLWDSAVALPLVRQIGLATDMQKVGLNGLTAKLREDRIRCQQRILERILAWADAAAMPAIAAAVHRDVALALEDDRQQKELQIQALERQIAARLVRTPYIVLLSLCGIHVVSAAEYAAEMGPISRYANPTTITGRAGLRPSRYQSDEVDRADGPLVRCANRRLRFAILQIADNLIVNHPHFRSMADRWKTAGKDPRLSRVKVGSRFARISYHMVTCSRVFRHPVARGRDYILKKLMDFHQAHGTPMNETLADFQAVIEQLPKSEYAAEAAPLVKELEKVQKYRSRGPQLIGEILPLVLAKLGIAPVQSVESGDGDPAEP